MDVLFHLLILWAVVALVIGVMFLSQRSGVPIGHLPFAGAFGFVGAAFGVVIGMTTFFASQHYANVRHAAEGEATAIGDVAALSGSFPHQDGVFLRQQLFCYATEVIDREWTKTDGEPAPSVEGRQRAGYAVLLKVGRQHPNPDSWYSNALRAGLQAGEQRQERLLLSEPQIPTLLWILIYVGAGIVVLFAIFFHLESRAQLIGMLVAVTVMLTAIVGVLAGLDTPTQGPLGLKPDAMEAERELLTEDVDTRGRSASAFCAALPYPENDPRALQ